MQVLMWIGLGFELFGSIVVGLGVYDSFQSFRARGGEWHYEDRLSVWREWIRRRVLRRPPRNRSGSAHMESTSKMFAGGYAPARLPNPWRSPKKFSTAVETALNKIQSDVSLLQVNLDREAYERTNSIEQIRRSVEVGEHLLEERIQEVEVSGLRLEAVGLALILIGTVSAAIGSTLSS